MVSAVLCGAGHAVPGEMPQQAMWDDFFGKHFGFSPVAERIWRSSGITMRHGVIDPRVEDISEWGTGARMRRFVTEAMPLGKDAVAVALDRAGVAAADVDLFGVVSCTGYATPGLDILLARDLGMPATVQRLFVGHMGCYAAIPGLAAVSDSVRSRDLTAVLLCLELTSLHLQPPPPGLQAGLTDAVDIQQVVAHALFSDAAAAVVLKPTASGLEVVDITAKTDVERQADMTWDVTDLGFRMGLSPQVPDVLARHVRGVVDELLERNGLAIPAVRGWAVHPGGPRILDVCEEELELAPDEMAASRATLDEFGNCSSATVLLVLDKLLVDRPPRPGDAYVALAFGPGLTLYGALLRAT